MRPYLMEETQTNTTVILAKNMVNPTICNTTLQYVYRRQAADFTWSNPIRERVPHQVGLERKLTQYHLCAFYYKDSTCHVPLTRHPQKN